MHWESGLEERHAPSAPPSRWSTLTQETVDGRVWEGVHFRFSDEIAAEVGKDVAWHDVRRGAGRALECLTAPIAQLDRATPS